MLGNYQQTYYERFKTEMIGCRVISGRKTVVVIVEKNCLNQELDLSKWSPSQSGLNQNA